MNAKIESLKLVVIEDQEAHFELMKRAIIKEFPQATITHFDHAGSCLEQLPELKPDLILADYLMPGMNGIEFLEALQWQGLGVPVIMLTGQGNESIAVQAMKLGAWDYLIKSADIFKLLPGTIEKVIRERRLRDALRESSRLNDLLLNSLPHPAMLVNRNHVVLAANRIALEIGARINELCWQSYGSGEYISEGDKRFLRAHPDVTPPSGIQCTHCRSNEAFASGQPTSANDICAFGRNWDCWWIPIDADTQLVYAIDITAHKQAEQQIHKLTQQILKVQEMERQRLAYDLHDSIGQELSSIKIGMETILDQQPEACSAIKGKVTGLVDLLQGTIEAVRNLAYELRPPVLDQLGLVQTLQEYCEEFAARQGVQVDFYAAGMDDLDLDSDTRIALYRLVQESLNNVNKHAAASNVSVRLVASFPSIILRVEDNGVGFDVTSRMNDARNERCMGLHGMEERVNLLGGTIKIESRPMNGTRIRIEVPFGDSHYGAEKDHLDH